VKIEMNFIFELPYQKSLIIWAFWVLQAAARYIHGTLRNSSMTISNMIGPMEQVTMANHPLKGFYFMTPGLAQVILLYLYNAISPFIL
jgi:hypothetical protein